MRFGPVATVGVLLGLAPILTACGGEQTAAAGGEAATATSRQAAVGGAGAHTTASGRRCGRQLHGLLDSMESLNNSLAVGMSYESYLGAVDAVRITYAKVPVDRLPIGCLARVAAPAEGALNVYIDAVNTWGDCLATASCDPETVEPKLQRKWEGASDLLSSAQNGLRDLD